VSQPCNRSCKVPLPGKLDAELHEFWSENPWELITKGNNLSCFERKRMFLNIKGQDFLEISHLSGTDNIADGRCVVAADFRNIGMLDIVTRNAGGPPLILYENRLPRKHYLIVSLRGHKSNRQGIGARMTAMVIGQQLVRELYPANTYYSQWPSNVHFGLADAQTVDNLTIRWPSGKVQVLKNVKGDRHIVVDEQKEGDDAIETVVPGKVIAP
jgi:enediyne biosynthesis protein E4